MTGIRSHARQVSLSVTGILVLVLLIGPACVPLELRADAASRIAGLAQYFDTALADAWHTAFRLRGSDNRTGVSASHNGSGSHPGAPLVLTGGEAPPSAAAGAGFVDMNGLGLGSFNAGYGPGSASNSIAGLLGDMLKDGNLGTGGGFEAFARGAGGGNDPASSRGAGDHHSSGTGASTDGAAPATLSRSSSNKGTPRGSAPSHSRNSEGTLRLTDVKPDAHQDRVTALGNGFVSVYDDAGTSWEQVASSSESLNGLFSDELGGSDWSGGPRDGGTGEFARGAGGGNDPASSRGAGDHHSSGTGASTDGAAPATLSRSSSNALDPTTGDLLGQLLNGLDDPLQSEDLRGSVFHNEVNGHGPFDKPVMTPEPDSGPVGSVPEPGSLVLLSLGLGAVILWRKFRIGSLDPATENQRGSTAG